MTELQARLRELAQEDFPIDERPFLRLAERLGTTEAEVIETFAELFEQGLIRELSAFLDPSRLGYRSTLACVTVPAAHLAEVSELLAAMPEVTHSYLRDHPCNLWFTVIAASPEAIQGILSRLQEQTGLGPIHNLPAERMFKIRANFAAGQMAP